MRVAEQMPAQYGKWIMYSGCCGLADDSVERVACVCVCVLARQVHGVGEHGGDYERVVSSSAHILSRVLERVRPSPTRATDKVP